MLEIWEFVLILFGAELLVGLIAAPLIWRQYKKSKTLEEEKGPLEFDLDEILLEELYTSKEPVEVGHPPQSYETENIKPIIVPSYNRYNKVFDYHRNDGYAYGRGMSSLTLPEYRSRASLSDIAVSEDRNSMGTRMSTSHSPTSAAENLTPVNTPIMNKRRKAILLEETNGKFKAATITRPKMGEQSSFTLYSEETFDSGVDSVEQNKPLWDTNRAEVKIEQEPEGNPDVINNWHIN